MYQILCDNNILFDSRDEDLVLLNPKCKLEVNACGEASFTIPPNHPHRQALAKLRSVFEIVEDGETIFRGRMTNDTKDFNNLLDVDLEGALAYANDTIIPPFKFSNSADAKEGEHDAQFADAANAENVVEYLLQWVIDRHNEQASDFQKFQLGEVTVTAPNNTIKRWEEGYSTTWDILRSKFFESSLGGYMFVRYGADGVNYIDYLSAFRYTNIQMIEFGENLMGLECQTNADETYTAMLPIGAETERTESGGNDYKGEYVSIENTITVNEALTLDSLPDGALSDDGDIVKNGKFIYSKKGVGLFGWICMPPEESKFDDVTTVDNLKAKAIAALKSKATTVAQTMRIQGLDLHCTDDQIAAFRICKNVRVISPPHGINATYPLERMEIDIQNPQNTIFTLGATERVLTSNANRTAKSLSKIATSCPTNVDMFEKVNRLENAIFEAKVTTDEACQKVTISASKKYATQDDVNGVENDLIGIDGRLTTAEATIEVMPEQILQSVAGTYVTKDGLEEEVSGVLALEILQAADGSYYSQLRSEVDKVVFASDEIEIESDDFTLKEGRITTKSGTQETIIRAGNITHQWRDDSLYYEIIPKRYYNRVEWSDSILRMSREYQTTGFSGYANATIGWWNQAQWSDDKTVYWCPFLITSERITIGSVTYRTGAYDTIGELIGKEWTISPSDYLSMYAGSVSIGGDELTINGVNFDDLVARVAALERKV